MDLWVSADGVARWGRREFRCALGHGGIAARKTEGDGTTPEGRFPMRGVLYRPDQLAEPSTRLPLSVIIPNAGWCDDPADPLYNRRVTLPYPASAERLWREDRLYDVIVPLGYNDQNIIAGLGSAIFLHVARADYGATEGCVAVALDDLLRIVREAEAGSCIVTTVTKQTGACDGRISPY